MKLRQSHSELQQSQSKMQKELYERQLYLESKVQSLIPKPGWFK